MTRDELVSHIKANRLDSFNLYALLCQAATDNADKGAQAFITEVEALLAAALGQNNYLAIIEMAYSLGGFIGDTAGQDQGMIYWGGDRGCLPGLGSQYGVTCLVFPR
jgi:hypothetical protein